MTEPMAALEVVLALFPEEGREAISAVVALVGLFGLVSIYLGYRTGEQADRMADTEVSPIADTDEGLVAIEGVARPADAPPVEQPGRDGDTCLGYHRQTTLHITRHEPEDLGDHGDDDFSRPETETRRTSSAELTRFIVEDDTGRAVVAADEDRPEVTFEHDYSLSESTDGDREGTLVLGEDADLPAYEDRDYDHRISLLSDGDEVVVYGHATDDGDVTIGADPDTGDFLVSTSSFADETASRKRSAPIRIAIGVLLSVGAVGLLGYEWVIA